MNEIPAAGRISTLVLELGTSERVWECSAMSQGVTRLQPPTNTPASSRIGPSNAERDSSVLERTGNEKEIFAGNSAIYESVNYTDCTLRTFMNYQREMGAYFDAYNKNTTANRDNSCTYVLTFLISSDEELQLRSSPHEWNRLHLSDWTMPNSSRTQCTVFKRSILSNLIFSPEPSGMVANRQGSIPTRNFGIVDTSPSALVRTLEVCK